MAISGVPHPSPDPASPGPGPIRFALHGGAGEHAAAGPQSEYRAALRRIGSEAQAMLLGGASALDAVTRAVELLEECPLFNAGVGAVLNRDGVPELDAAVMSGVDRTCGAVAGVSRVQSPVRLARAVMERTPHVFFAGAGAEQLALDFGLPRVEPAYFVIRERLLQLEQARRSGAIELDRPRQGTHAPPVDEGPYGTVGAVARDAQGHLAAATSTGGLTNKLPGRIGDSPVVGAGTFADDSSCAVSCTGTGEAYIRAGFAHALHARLAWCGWELERACAESLDAVDRYGGRGGCIAIDRNGNVAAPFNSQCLYRAWAGADGVLRVAIHAGEQGR
jgi:beta-aspartyl-peptidase (threonine type)